MGRNMGHRLRNSKLRLCAAWGTLGPMTRDEIDSHCKSLPGAEMVVQWEGCHVWKVGGKVFAISVPDQERITFKCDHPDTAAFLIEIGVATIAPHLPRGGWVAMAYATEAADLVARVSTSYKTVFAALPKARQAEIG